MHGWVANETYIADFMWTWYIQNFFNMSRTFLTFGKLGIWTDNIEVIYEVEDHCLMMVETNLCGVVDNERETETNNTVTR